MALTPFDMEGVNRDLLAAGNPAKPDMQSILRRNARDLVLEYARYLSRFQAPRERRTLFARTESDIAAAFREETANHSWNADDLASQAGIDPRFADALLQRGEAPIEAVFSAADALGIDIAALPLSSLGNTR